MENQFCIRGTAPVLDSQSELVGMLDYYRGDHGRQDGLRTSARMAFDPIICKYDLDKIADGILDNAPKGKLPDDTYRVYWSQYYILAEEIKALETKEEKRTFICERVYQYLRDYESSHELASLTKKDFTHVMENLYMIYNTDHEEIRRVVQVIDLISQNVINKYIQIDGLERLFNEQYIDFEWEMHLGMDHKQQTMKFYRDHFIHQVRDAYMMDRLLRDGGFYERTLRVLKQPSASKVSQYFCKMVERQREMPLPNEALLKYDSDFIPRNIIYMSAYMAGLFHDIGYPNTYLQSLRRRISVFAPSMNSGNPIRDTLPKDIFSLLQNSLLFRLVPFEEIQTRVYQDSIDHGTLSAIAFLLHFYENGVIFMLPPYQAAAVELAGLAIYNHTYIYGISGPSKKGANDYRPRFLTNPISYLLRLCDDLQEWDRVYFEISSQSNLITCKRCRTPIIGQLPPKDETGRDCRIRRYVCNCYSKDEIEKKGGAFSRTFDGDLSFPYRRLYNIEVCDYVQVVDMNGKGFDSARDICFTLHYNPYKLLHITYISPHYARYRIKELNNLKPLLLNQSELPRMWLDYFVTANPILLKTHLLEEYFKKCSGGKPIRSLISELWADKSGNIEALNAVIDKLMEQLRFPLDSWAADASICSITYIREEVERALQLYSMLYIYGQIFRCRSDRPSECPQWIADEIRRRYCAPGKDEEFQCLLGDCLLQLGRLYTKDQLLQLKCIPEAYIQQFAPGNWKKALTGQAEDRCSKEFYDYALEWYVNQHRYNPICWNMTPIEKKAAVDAFTDLGFFQTLYKNTPPNSNNH